MARITVEDCLKNETNRFTLVRIAASRAKQLLKGHEPVTNTRGNKAIVTALREIAAGKIIRLDKGDIVHEKPATTMVEAGHAADTLAAITSSN